ncbi:hypothetical protein [Cytobacillus dafuensis]|uniref:GIY-YIG nuclease family protein n=1 Tax=Cytobacillus dafuensis TaxID=1742359 RepID=A0A5B8Z966_CYTDA|nr:hypothetical protein [Cytobacillus dafuensis]QED49665.1 hypothetical protein FSZ17_21655 [Cytobacillus dafuensis]
MREIDLLSFLDLFSSKVKGSLFLRGMKTNIETLRMDNSFIEEIKNECGIYYFIQDEQIVYVGRALPSVGLKSRILNQINAFGDTKWDTVINDNKTEIGVIIFEDFDQWYFISALEHFLIEKLERPIFNKRC